MLGGETEWQSSIERPKPIFVLEDWVGQVMGSDPSMRAQYLLALKVGIGEAHGQDEAEKYSSIVTGGIIAGQSVEAEAGFRQAFVTLAAAAGIATPEELWGALGG